MTRASLYNYDNTVAVVGDTKQNVIDALSQESQVAVDWIQVNIMEANPTKFQAIILRNVDYSTNISIRDNNIPSAKQVILLLGVTIDNRLYFQQYHFMESVGMAGGGAGGVNAMFDMVYECLYVTVYPW